MSWLSSFSPSQTKAIWLPSGENDGADSLQKKPVVFIIFVSGLWELEWPIARYIPTASGANPTKAGSARTAIRLLLLGEISNRLAFIFMPASVSRISGLDDV